MQVPKDYATTVGSWYHMTIQKIDVIYFLFSCLRGSRSRLQYHL